MQWGLTGQRLAGHDCACSTRSTNQDDNMTVSDAVSTLWAHGYRANVSPILPGYITVLDPVRTLPTSETPARVTHQRLTLHASSVARFITERS